jgi:hypothetical protein
MSLDSLFVFFIQQNSVGRNLSGGAGKREGEGCDVETCIWVEECSDLATLTGHRWIILVRDQITNCISRGTGGAADIFS